MNPSFTSIADVPWIVWTIALPFAAAVAAFVVRTGAAALGIITATGVGAAVAALTWQIGQLGPQRHQMGGWGAPLGIDLYADGLSAAMLLMTTVVGGAVTVYAARYFVQHRQGSRYFWSFWLFLWAALNALFLSGDIFNLYVTLELVTLAAVGLVALAGGADALRASLRYLLAALFGSLVYLLGVALLYASYGTLDIAALGRVMTPGTLSGAAVALITIGLAVKAALFPLHFWLPPAHAGAPAPASALLSALVVKAAFYLLLRLWFDAFPAVATAAAGSLLGMLGVGAIVWGSLQAWFAPRLKSLVAYSTVAQLGYLFLAFTLASPGEKSTAWSGSVLFAVSHGCAKASVFLVAGIVLHAVGHDTIADLRGAGRRLPMAFFTMALAGVTLMGLPPSGAFVAKWMLIQAAVERGQAWLAVVIVAGGLAAAGYLFRVVAYAFQETGSDDTPFVPPAMEWSALALALVALSLGFVAAPFLDLLQVAGR